MQYEHGSHPSCFRDVEQKQPGSEPAPGQTVTLTSDPALEGETTGTSASLN